MRRILNSHSLSLQSYNEKRTFDLTPEPTGGKGSSGELAFVVQKHDASRLHYDFRLELTGVLKSWAVPKGPSLNPTVKHLAMMVEDHPMDYRTFEGVIPKGNYGAGKVIVWDQGTYEPLTSSRLSKKAQEKLVAEGIEKGNLKIKLEGTKLHGEFALVKTAYRDENSWLLIKHKDSFSTTDDITLEDKSVISGRTIEMIEGSA